MAEAVRVAGTERAFREQAFSRLLATELATGYRTATLILRDPEEAEDALQDALIRAWQHWDDLRDESRVRAWFGRILVNVCRDRLRARPHTVVTDLTTLPLYEASGASDDRDALWQAIGVLSPEHRFVVVLRYYLDLSLAEIAGRVGTSEGTVKSRLHYALSALRAAYDANERTMELVR